ncbi:hypothetical protein L2U10_13945, partial [Staphylococcus aureus]|nr:hypothetical protein [Staphylococcus aureus]
MNVVACFLSPKTLCTTSIIEHSFSSSGEYCLKSTYAALPFIKYNLIYNGLLKKIHTIHYKQ